MGYMIQITEDSAMEMKEHARKALKHMGKFMERFEEICEEGGSMGERGDGSYGNRGGGRYGNRGGYGGGNSGGGSYGNRMDYREDDERIDEDDMGERRYRSSRTGRYVRG